MAEKNTEADLPGFRHLEMSSADLKRDSTSDNLTALKTDIREIANIEVTDEQNRRVLRKIDRCLLPIMGIAFMLQFLDKAALAASTLLGLLDPTTGGIALVGSQFAWCSSIFYFGYLLFSFPSAYLVVRFPIGKYLASLVILWGGILMCTAACKTFSALMAQRFFLGVAEAAITPGFSLVTGMFYTRKEQPLRQGAWFIGNCLALILGGLITYGVKNIPNPPLPHWKLLYLFVGAATCAYGVFMIFVLPDSVMTAWFLNHEDRTIALARTLKNKTGVLDNGVFKWGQFNEAFRDPQTWLIALYNVAINLPNGALNTFQPLIVNGLGFNTLTSILLQMPTGGNEIVFLLITSSLASLLPHARVLIMIFNCVVAMVGLVLVYSLKSQAGQMTGVVFAATYAINIPICLSLITSNVSGFTKRSTVSAIVFAMYCVGNIAGPQFYLERQKPRYQMGLISSLAGYVFGTTSLICLYTYYRYENRRRDRVYGSESEVNTSQELTDELSNETDRTITSFRYMM
ncbi:hypothetical protein VF21_05577 [Pseudogymnoascus sp. 05NY08]|nr:hypothetical protein VF21_05577 [Pseudogymnoascus sp. 05NY08]